MYDTNSEPLPPQETPQPNEDELKYADIKISHVEHLSIISYLTKAIEDALIKRMSILKYPLLLIDLPLLFAVLIVNLERLIYTHVVDFVMAHIKFDIRIITKNLQKIIPIGKKTEQFSEEEEEEEEPYEETTSGRLFQWLRNFIRFVWGLFILGIVLPIWPLIFLYNLFIEVVIVGSLYYFLIFYHFPEWWGMLLYFMIFCTVTFIISSISVPALLRTFIYLKYLFSLERKSWREINNEAKSAFLKFYLRIQQNRKDILDKIEPRYEGVQKVEGGVYYLLLKIVYWIKDKFWNLRKKRVSDIFHKVERGVQYLTTDLEEEKVEYQKTISSMQPEELIKTSIALLLTFLFSILLVLKGTSGQGLIGPILVSFFDAVHATSIWTSYQGSNMGYYEFLAQSTGFLPGFIRILARGVDYLLQYFFQFYYYILPIYLNFIVTYYRFYFGRIFSAIFY